MKLDMLFVAGASGAAILIGQVPQIELGEGGSTVVNLGAIGFITWYAYHVTTKAIPAIRKEHTAELEKYRQDLERYRAERDRDRNIYNEESTQIRCELRDGLHEVVCSVEKVDGSVKELSQTLKGRE